MRNQYVHDTTDKHGPARPRDCHKIVTLLQILTVNLPLRKRSEAFQIIPNP